MVWNKFKRKIDFNNKVSSKVKLKNKNLLNLEHRIIAKLMNKYEIEYLYQMGNVLNDTFFVVYSRFYYLKQQIDNIVRPWTRWQSVFSKNYYSFLIFRDPQSNAHCLDHIFMESPQIIFLRVHSSNSLFSCYCVGIAMTLVTFKTNSN